MRPITLFTGQWADLSFEEVCEKASAWGYEGLEVACWGDHIDPHRAATDLEYVRAKKKVLEDHGLKCWAIGAHIEGQCVGDLYDKRLDNFVPLEVRGNPDSIRRWGIEQMKYAAVAAKNMGCNIVTGFMGSPIWKFFYSFPQTTEEMIEDGYRQILRLWTPILDEFDRNGVKFALEVHPTEIAFDYYTTRKLLEIFDNRPALGLNFDPSHLIWQGVNPALFLRHFKSRIYHVHVKDASVNLDGLSGILGSHLPFGDLKRGWNFRSPGRGNVNFEEIIRELNSMNYNGPLSIEWEDSGMDREYGAKEALEFVKKIDFPMSKIAFDNAIKK